LTFISLFLIGGITFFSATFGILNRNEIKFYGMLEGQLYAYLIGILLMLLAFSLPYVFVYKISPLIYASSILLGFLVFVPGLGASHGGATRWLNIGGFSLQPGDILKLSIIIITAWYIKKYSNKLNDYRYSIVGYGLILLPAVIVMFLQKDLGTLLIIGATSFAMYFNSKVKLRSILLILLLGAMVCSLYVATNSYVRNRIFSYTGETKDVKGISYQNDQALLAIGNGGYFGRGFGQSIQKFHYLPEPAGDSVFAVYAEEFGFFGSVFLVFARNFILGFATLLFLQTVLNIGSMLKIIPLSGDTLPFFSQGGTALICNLVGLGFLFQLTKQNK
jgi:cell division protein FtsW